MLYGHRNDPKGYAAALEQVDGWLPGALAQLGPDDLLLITADHGCDPSTPSTDHSRENVPLLAYGAGIAHAIWVRGIPLRTLLRRCWKRWELREKATAGAFGT